MNNDNFHPDHGTLIDYLHGELAPGSDASLLTHLEACAHCRAALDDEARIGEIMRAQARATERELPQGVVATIWSAVERDNEAADSWWERLRAALRPAIAVPLAAMLVVAFAVFGMPALHGNGTAAAHGVDAAYLLDDHAALSATLPFADASAAPSSLVEDRPGDQQWVADAANGNGPVTH